MSLSCAVIINRYLRNQKRPDMQKVLRAVICASFFLDFLLIDELKEAVCAVKMITLNLGGLFVTQETIKKFALI